MWRCCRLHIHAEVSDGPCALASRSTHPTPPQPCSALSSLPRLRLLSLTLTEALPAGHHRQLAALRSLEELHLYFLPSQPTAFEFHPSGLAALTRLRSVLLIAPPDSMCQPLTIGPGMSKLAALQELQVGIATIAVLCGCWAGGRPCPPLLPPLHWPPSCQAAAALQVESRVERLPADLWSCLHLTRLDLDLAHAAGLPAPATPATGAAPLPALLELRLARYRLQGGALPPPLCQLSTLSHLEVLSCGLTSSAAHAGLPDGFSCLTQLVSWRVFLWGRLLGGGSGRLTAKGQSHAAMVSTSYPCGLPHAAGAPVVGGQRAVHAAPRAVHAACAAPPGPVMQPAGECSMADGRQGGRVHSGLAV